MWNSGLNNFFVKLKHIDKNENWVDNFFRQIKAWKKPRWSDIFFVKSKLTNKRFPFFMNLKILFFLWNQNALKKAKLVTLLYSTRIYICGDVLNFGSIIKRSSTSPVVMSILIILHKEDRSSSEYDWLMAIVNMSNEPSLSWLVMSWGIFKHATDKNGLGGSLISSCK